MTSRLPVALSAGALVLALLASSPLGEAAKRLVLPPGSVGTAQLRKNAVTSIKVKDRSLKAIDFARGELPAGMPGPAGPVGPAGPTGPSDVYTGVRTAMVPIVPGVVTGRLSVPEAGKYMVFAKVVIINPGSAVHVLCQLAAGTDMDVSEAQLGGPADPASSLVLELQVPHEFTAPGEAVLACSDGTGAAQAAHERITAIRVGSLVHGALSY